MNSNRENDGKFSLGCAKQLTLNHSARSVSNYIRTELNGYLGKVSELNRKSHWCRRRFCENLGC